MLIGSILSTTAICAAKQVFEDPPLERRNLGRAAVARTRKIDANVHGDLAMLDHQHAIGQRNSLSHVSFATPSQGR